MDAIQEQLGAHLQNLCHLILNTTHLVCGTLALAVTQVTNITNQGIKQSVNYIVAAAKETYPQIKQACIQFTTTIMAFAYEYGPWLQESTASLMRCTIVLAQEYFGEMFVVQTRFVLTVAKVVIGLILQSLMAAATIAEKLIHGCYEWLDDPDRSTLGYFLCLFVFVYVFLMAVGMVYRRHG
ncbi:hypothetical protein PV08_07183 [Exophiala spinifera]|uniref:Uncharacterized protein n=1 Tax=Exophiala spinifera TaxID=91928 RepID=A0A0D1YHK1_9EURO|nr:uncharacterized protein PV08_07183 [Exophiala spinifera]KIW14401.1 hypothetical protein PV08_07183 [Exophiala spinifera]